MKFILSLILLLTFSLSFAGDIIKIDINKSGKSYSKKELQRRVKRLERAVWQLQQRVFNLETTNTPAPTAGAEWICKIKAMGDVYTGIGGSKAVAIHRATENCKKGRDGDGFFCKSPKCEK